MLVPVSGAAAGEMAEADVSGSDGSHESADADALLQVLLHVQTMPPAVMARHVKLHLKKSRHVEMVIPSEGG
jgi:hypothetical protein